MTAAKVHNIPEIKAGFVKINENLRLRHSNLAFKKLNKVFAYTAYTNSGNPFVHRGLSLVYANRLVYAKLRKGFFD